jgi:hypothetical protein
MIEPVIQKFTTFTTVMAILSLSACSMFGGDADDPLIDLREHVQSTVHDSDRAGAMLVSLDQLDQLLIESAKLLVEVAQQESVLFADYDSTQQDFKAIFSDTSRKRQELQKAMLDVHLEFKAMATPEEWASILPVHASAVSMRIESLVIAATAERG